jgi:hypothetical protein
VYIEIPLSDRGVPFDHFLICPRQPIDAEEMRLAPRGVTLVERDGVTHVIDWIGSVHYPNVADFVAEARHLGISRRIARSIDFGKLSRDSRLLLAHSRAHMLNAGDFYRGLMRDGWAMRCPKGIPEHNRLAPKISDPKEHRPQQPADFWSKVDTGPGCWEWSLSTTEAGYGQVWASGKMTTSHRRAWELSNGPIPAGLEVCHKCDNKRCARPGHLFLGTHAENMADHQAKGRARAPRNEASPAAKLTDQQVAEIRQRRADGETLQALGDAFGVHHSTILRICREELRPQGGEGPPCCCGLYWDDVEGGEAVLDPSVPWRTVERTIGETTYRARRRPDAFEPEYALAIFASFPIGRLVVIDDPDAPEGVAETLKRVREAQGLDVTLEEE